MQFFKRYNYIMLIVFFLVFSAALGLLHLQYHTQYQHKMSNIKSAFEERALRLDMLRVAKDHVEGMKLQAETYWLTHPVPPQNSTLFSQLQPIADDGYSLDQLRPPFTEKIVGNLTGKGSLHNRDANFYREVAMALELNPLFQVIAHNIPNAVWIYYISANRFINIYPWVNSQHFVFNDELYDQELYKLGLPEHNPQRRTFWTEAYIDEAGTGLMVTCATPVYDGERFMGTVALDITLNVLNKFVQHFHAHSENLFIINQNNQLLAHTYLVDSTSKTVPPANLAFPEALPDTLWQTLFQAPEAKIVEIGGYLMIYQNLNHLPWKLIFWIPKQQVMREVFYEIGWGFMVLLPSLLIILLLTYHITQQEFIRPAQYLVEHIESENCGFDLPIPDVPASWRIWFVTVSRIFAENRRLFNELKNYSASLEERAQMISENNQQLSFKNAELERLNREKNEFLGIVAHDLKNPLAGISGLTELILGANDETPMAELFEHTRMIQTGSDNMFQLITNLLDVNVIESGKINVSFKTIELDLLIQRVINSYLERATRKNITIHFEKVTEISPILQTDRQITEQILDNLVSNAIKYSPHGKTVWIRLTDTVDWLCCEIQDEGQGLNEEEQQKLFTKFSRLSPRPTGDEHSTGLGLFIVKKLADAIHARVECRSEVGKGTCFIVEFPKKHADF